MSSTPPPSPSGDDSPAPLPPPHIPDHELIRRIGRGAYGEVWLARSVTGAFRAVKMVHRRSFDHDRPFEREFEGILKFEPVSRTHDSQVDILHVGRSEDYFYYVMELADDQTTGGQINPDHYTPRTLKSDLLFHGRLPFDECVRIGLALTTALEQLHTQGLVHRDVKPSNIIFVNGVPKLADIGLVTGVDATRSYVGTEGFAAPEGPGTPQADLFSLGKVLYELATGKDRQEFPELPTQLRELPDREGLMELNAVIARACRHDPKDRYTSAATMRADLELLQSGRSLAQLHRVQRRLRFVTRAGVAVAALAVLILAGWLYQARQTEQVRELANQNRKIAEEKTRLAAEKSALAEENRERVVRLDIANGVRVMDEGDSAGALLWFAEALPLMNRPAEEAIHRIRIQQALNQTPRLLDVLPHESPVSSSAFSPDASRIATGTFDGFLRVWNARDGSLVLGPKRMSKIVQYIRFTHDGGRLFVSSTPEQYPERGQASMGFFAILDASSGREILPASAMVPGMATNVVWSTFSSDDRWLAVSARNKRLYVFDLHDGRRVIDVEEPTALWVNLSFSANGNFLGETAGTNGAWVRRVPSGELVFRTAAPGWRFARAIPSDDGKYLLTGAFTNTECAVRAWDVRTGNTLGEPIKGVGSFVMFVEPGAGARFFTSTKTEGHRRTHVHVWHFDPNREALSPLATLNGDCWAFSPDGKRLALGGGDKAAKIFDLSTGESIAPLPHNAGTGSVQFSPDGHRLLTGSGDGTARLWDILPRASEAMVMRLPAAITKEEPNTFIAWGATPGPVPVPLVDGTLQLVDVERMAGVHRLATPRDDLTLKLITDRLKVQGLTKGDKGRCWAIPLVRSSNGAPAGVVLWREENGMLHQRYLSHPDGVDTMRFTQDERLLVTCGMDHIIRFWRTADGVLERTLNAPKSDGYVAAISPDTRTAIWDGDLIEWFDLGSGSIIGEPCTGIFLVRAEFAPDSSRLALIDPNGPVTVLDGRNGRVVSTVIKHFGHPSWGEWAPDGSRLLTADMYTEEALAWDPAAGTQALVPLRMPGGSIQAARWSPDGRLIVTRSAAHLVRVWDSATGEAITPLFKHEGDVRFAFLTPGNRLITASDPDQIHARDLRQTSLPSNILGDYAKLVSGRYLNRDGVILPLKPDELIELCRSLRARAPQLFE